jgi:predicted acyltransferase
LSRKSSNRKASPKNTSLLFALAFVLVWLGLTRLLYRRRIFVRI